MEAWQLKQRQSLPLEVKIIMSQNRIREWYEHWDGQVYVSFSGGKDSTVLLHLVRGLYPDVLALFCDTGLEYPEIRQFVRTVENVTWIRPKMKFQEVIEKYGWPVVSKQQAQYIYEFRTAKSEKTKRTRMLGHGPSKIGRIKDKWKYLINAPFKISDKCCNKLKKDPFKRYGKETGAKAFIGMMAEEGRMRQFILLRHGCNAFVSKHPTSNPLMFWTEADIWQYIRRFNVPYSKIYDMGHDRTGCMFCAFGVHLEPSPNRFERMKQTNPKLWQYCMFKLGLAEVLDYMGVPYGQEEEK